MPAIQVLGRLSQGDCCQVHTDNERCLRNKQGHPRLHEIALQAGKCTETLGRGRVTIAPQTP